MFHLIAVYVYICLFIYLSIIHFCLIHLFIHSCIYFCLFTTWIVLVCFPKCKRAPPPSENKLQGQGQVTSFCLGAGQGRST